MTFWSIVGHASVHNRAGDGSLDERAIVLRGLTVSVATGLASLLHHGSGKIAPHTRSTMRIISLLLAVLLQVSSAATVGKAYRFEKIADGVYYATSTGSMVTGSNNAPSSATATARRRYRDDARPRRGRSSRI